MYPIAFSVLEQSAELVYSWTEQSQSWTESSKQASWKVLESWKKEKKKVYVTDCVLRCALTLRCSLSSLALCWECYNNDVSWLKISHVFFKGVPHGVWCLTSGYMLPLLISLVAQCKSKGSNIKQQTCLRWWRTFRVKGCSTSAHNLIFSWIQETPQILIYLLVCIYTHTFTTFVRFCFSRVRFYELFSLFVIPGFSLFFPFDFWLLCIAPLAWYSTHTCLTSLSADLDC